MDCLRSIQCELKAPKGQYNSFGKYSYRSCEDILEAVKPLLDKYKATVYITDEVGSVGDRIYVKATATFVDKDGKEVSVSAFAREPVARKGMDEAQVTGATSSYARKYALNGLFLIDDNKDADTDENRNETEARSKASGSDTPKSDAPKVQRPNYTAEQIEKMKKWTDRTFTEDELAEFRKRCCGADYADAIEDINGEYEKRKAIF
jgi:hypothetical protein